MKRTPGLFFEDREGWRGWLARNHRDKNETWLLFYKKHTGKPTLSYEEAVEEAVCFGWIDGVIRRVDDERCARKFMPRRAKSSWSKVNVGRAERMIREGRMTEAGLARFRGAEVRAPLTAREDLELPPELVAGLRRNAAAWANYGRLAPSQKRLYVGWILSAKKAETRLRRLREAVARLERGEKLGLK